MRYLSTTTDGRTVENWHAINRDSKRLEKIWRGKFQSHPISFAFYQRRSISTRRTLLIRRGSLPPSETLKNVYGKGGEFAGLLLRVQQVHQALRPVLIKVQQALHLTSTKVPTLVFLEKSLQLMRFMNSKMTSC